MKFEDEESYDQNVKLFHLAGDVYVGDSRYIHKHKPEEKPKLSEEDKKEIANKHKSRFNKAKENGKRLMTLTEDDTNFNSKKNEFYIGNLTRNYIKENGAVMSHMIAFTSIARLAVAMHYRIGYGEYRRKIKQTSIKHEWKLIRNWISDNVKDSIIAVSIGVGLKGYVYIRFIATSSDKLKVHDTSISLAHYLRRNRKYYPKELKPFDKSPEAFITGKYCNDIKTVDDIVNNIPEELWQVMRAGFILPFTHRTYKNGLARILIDKSAENTKLNDLGVNSIMFGLCRAFLEKDEASGELITVDVFEDTKTSEDIENVYDDGMEECNIDSIEKLPEF